MSGSKPKLYLNLYWHMHQPDYRDTLTGEYVLPWTYLHATKDYTDMAYHLEQNKAARVSFNYVPVLLDQLEDYAQQFKTSQIRDPLLALLSVADLAAISEEQTLFICDSCFKCNAEKMIHPFPAYVRLWTIYNALIVEGSSAIDYLSAQYKADLLVWYHLAWMGESIRRSNRLVQRLMQKGSHFTFRERTELFELIGTLISDLIPRYKKLQADGQIEISSTPHYHPILPLLLDFKSTRDAMPYAPLPYSECYPDGATRAVAHIQSAQQSHERRFGVSPVGMWPAEGAVSYSALSLMAEHGVQWAATGEGVLANSLYKDLSGGALPDRADYLYKPYRVTSDKDSILCFFRDDVLSDKIGFEYSNLHANEAVYDLVSSLEHIQKSNDSGTHRVVSIILDGENAWEYYPYNGYYFLSELYAALANHAHIEMVTFKDIVAKTKTPKLATKNKMAVAPLPSIAAGSWVYGTFSTWIGSTEKNNAWDLLCAAKTAYDKVQAEGKLNAKEMAACERQLAICEGSDWFWWFGDYNSSVSVVSFDRLYRRNLTNLYRLLKLEAPAELMRAISKGGGDPAVGGTMRRGQET